MIQELKLFKVQNDSLVFPMFYVEAVDILEATRIAKQIIDSLDNQRVVGTVSVVAIPLLKWEEE